MIKKREKWIALFVALTFIWLMQVSTMPIAAAGTAEQIGSANAEQGPDFIESESPKASPAAKKSILPYVLIGVGVVAVAAVLFLVVLKTKYDPVGSWSGPMSSIKDNWTGYAVFSGNKESGTIIYHDYSLTNVPGTYTVDGKNITFALNLGGSETVTFIGTFASKDKMSGTWQNDGSPSVNGNWELNRDASTLQQPVIRDLAGRKGLIAGK